MKKILIVTDAWYPQISGVVRTLEKMLEYTSIDNEVLTINPSCFTHSFPCPFYKEMLLAIPSTTIIQNTINDFKPDHIHILTEGPIGLVTSIVCKKMGLKFTTSFLTRFDKYIGLFIPFSDIIMRRFLRWFHCRAEKTFVSITPLKNELEGYGFKNIIMIPKGVDSSLFKQYNNRTLENLPKMLYVGRISKEKNLEAFLSLNIQGTKVLVGSGPELTKYKNEYPSAVFKGVLEGETLAMEYSSADVFVFPSVSETYGLVITEAMACGTPVAALPSDASSLLITNGLNGYVDDDLSYAIDRSLSVPRESCRKSVLSNTWKNSVDAFIKQLVPSKIGV